MPNAKVGKDKLNLSKNSLNLIHTSAIVYSDNSRRGVAPSIGFEQEEILSLNEERLSNLELIKYKENIVESDLS